MNKIFISSLEQGREYDEIGNMRNWWNNATLVQFKLRTKCIEEQYSGYRVLGSFIYYISTWRGRYRTIFPYKPDPMPISFRHTLRSRIQNLDLF